MLSDHFLARVRTCILQPQIESGGRTLQRLESHRAGDVSDTSETLRTQKSEATDGMHGLRTVQQCQAFFRFELERFQFRPLQRFGARHSLRLKERFAFTHKTQGKMRKWSEIPARADGA